MDKLAAGLGVVGTIAAGYATGKGIAKDIGFGRSKNRSYRQHTGYRGGRGFTRPQSRAVAQRKRNYTSQRNRPVGDFKGFQMPKSTWRRRRRMYGRKRGRAKKAYGKARRRASRFRGFRRRRRQRAPRHALRLYPGGFPKTKVIKLRVLKQVAISTVANGWGYIRLRPASMLDPFFDQSAVAPVGNHVKLRFLDKDNAADTHPQPYGYDQWLGLYPEVTPGPPILGQTNQYTNYTVLGSMTHITITHDIHAAAGAQFLAGWSPQLPNSSTDNLLNFQDRYEKVTSVEVADMLNCRIMKRPTLITSQPQMMRMGPTFSQGYSQRKVRAIYKRAGIELDRTLDFNGDLTTAPTINWRQHFIISDIAASTAIVKLNAIIEIIYTVRLSSNKLANQSVLG